MAFVSKLPSNKETQVHGEHGQRICLKHGTAMRTINFQGVTIDECQVGCWFLDEGEPEMLFHGLGNHGLRLPKPIQQRVQAVHGHRRAGHSGVPHGHYGHHGHSGSGSGFWLGGSSGSGWGSGS